jgi:hypothetical protein
MSLLDSCKHQLAVHGLAVELACDVPALNIPIHKALGEFAVAEFPDGFTPAVGILREYEESVVLRHLSPTAKPVAAMGSTMELYEEGERFWLIDDRWGLTEMNLLKGQFQSWILPRPAIDPGMIVQDAVLWPLAQLLRGKGLSLVPGISVARDGWGMLIISPFNMEPELTAMVRSGYKIVGQQWTAMREEDEHVAMLQMPGEVQRLPGPQLKAGSIEQTSSWVDLTGETLGSVQNHAFCDAVALVAPGRRPLPAMRQINRSNALATLKQTWPIIELHPQRRQGPMQVKLANQCRLFETQLSRRPEDFLKLLDQMRYQHSRPINPPEVQVMVDAKRNRQVPA